MEWSDEGIVLGARPFGESGAIAEIFTREHGRAAANGAWRREQAHAPDPASGQHGQPNVEGAHGENSSASLRPSKYRVSRPYAANIMEDAVALAGINSAVAMLRLGSAERQPYPNLFEALILLIEGAQRYDRLAALYARFELGLLAELGYGLDLSVCALTGVTDDLAFVSPRSGRAASREAGEQFADKLLRLPPFLTDPDKPVEEGDVADALALAGYFLERRLFDPQGQGMPPARVRLIERLGFAGRL
ncbi:MAG: DNA repair protein RecO [Alphaproteobacteria bacterium]